MDMNRCSDLSRDLNPVVKAMVGQHVRGLRVKHAGLVYNPATDGVSLQLVAEVADRHELSALHPEEDVSRKLAKFFGDEPPARQEETVGEMQQRQARAMMRHNEHLLLVTRGANFRQFFGSKPVRRK
ncbi:hypothetical protein [Bradyrhizobium cenepequi]|uniref:hypothetical protein n=1 Tax=Bradyrhizobium cenepequi TaxID=2821403 RepID=UPI001CE3798A|nr:hypothetical protein [Bradyrhizobium cenepequi]MCA6108117.1 hypothetical protein [Bradyrhizobium cenepequi]